MQANRVIGWIALRNRERSSSPKAAVQLAAISQGQEQSITATPGRSSRLLSGFIGHDLSNFQADSAKAWSPMPCMMALYSVCLGPGKLGGQHSIRVLRGRRQEVAILVVGEAASVTAE